MKNILIILSFILANLQGTAQSFSHDWHGNAPSQANASHYVIGSKLKGDTLYTLTRFNGDSLNAHPFGGSEWIYDEDPGDISNVVFISKHLKNGQFLGAYKLMEISGSSFSIEDFSVDNKGGIVLTGIGRDGMDFDPSSNFVGVYNIVTGQQGGICAFYDWSMHYQGHFEYPIASAFPVPTSGLVFESSVIDENNFLYLFGYYYGAMDFDFTAGSDIHANLGFSDIALIKVDLNAQTYVWGKSFGSDSYDYGYSIDCQNGKLALLGNYRGATIDMDPGAGVSNETKPVNTVDWLFVTQLNSDGLYINSYGFGGASDLDPVDLKIDDDGSIYFMGDYEYADVIDIDPSATTYNLPTSDINTVFLAKYTNGLSLDWVKAYGNNSYIQFPAYQGTALSLSDSYAAVLFIAEAGDLYLSDNTSHSLLISNAQSEMIASVMNKNSGALLDTMRYKAVDIYSYVGVVGIHSDQSQNLYLNGNFEGIVDFNLSDNQVINDTSFQIAPPYYYSNAFTTKLAYQGFTSIENSASSNGLQVYPNPTNDLVNIELDFATQEISILDINGRLILSKGATS